MEDQRSVNSPRRVLSLSRKRREILSSPEPGDKAAVFGPSGDHGPKPSEVYGFVGAISTVVATVIFLIWAYVPEPWLHYIGIFYYPSRQDEIEPTFLKFFSRGFMVIKFGLPLWHGWLWTQLRYWALAVPTYVMVTIVLAIGFYIGLNFMVTPPPTSLNTIFDEHSRDPSRFEPSVEDDEQPIEPLSDIGINQINDLMFNDQK